MLRRGLYCILLALAFPALSEAQTEPLADPPSSGVTTLVGIVDRIGGAPLATVRVQLSRAVEGDTLTWVGTTNRDGQLLTPPLLLGEYSLRAETLGYAPFADILALNETGHMDVLIEMVPEAVALDPVLVAVRRESRLEREGFFERQQQGLGTFITREDIESRGANRVSDIFYGVAGARVIPPRPGQPSAIVLLRGQCQPTVVLNGMAISSAIRLDELLHPQDIAGIEVYHGSAGPLQFAQFTTCGMIVVWTRDDQALEEGRPLTWRRIVAAVALVGFYYLINR